MKEISEKLANELMEMISQIEDFADKKCQETKKGKYDFDSDWLFISVAASSMANHLHWHMKGYKNIDMPIAEKDKP